MRDRYAGEQLSRAISVGRLTLQLQPQRLLRAVALSLRLLPLQVELRVSLGLPQRGDDDAGEPGLEAPRRPTAAFGLERLFLRWRRGALRPRAKFATPAPRRRVDHGTGIYLAPSQRSRKASARR